MDESRAGTAGAARDGKPQWGKDDSHKRVSRMEYGQQALPVWSRAPSVASPVPRETVAPQWLGRCASWPRGRRTIYRGIEHAACMLPLFRLF